MNKPAPFHSILFPIDFSPACTAMAGDVREMSRVCDAEVVLLYSFDAVQGYNIAAHLRVAGGSRYEPIPYAPSLRKLRAEKEEHLIEFAREQFGGWKCRTIMEDGEAASIIQGVAQGNNIDLIMMPTSGAGTFRRFLLGSITAKVLHDVDCAVFTTVQQFVPALPAPVHFGTIVCAVELNDEADTVLETADLLAQACGAKLVVLHVTESHLHITRSHAGNLTLDALVRRRGTTAVARILHESVPDGIRHTAVDESADLIVVGRGRERGAISRIWSNLYDIVRESPCPVLST